MLAAVFLSVILLKCQLPSNNALPPSNVGPVGPVDPVDPPATRVPPVTIRPPATVRPITLQPPCLCPVCPRWPPYPWDVPYPWPYPWCPWPCRRYYVYDVSEVLDAAIYRLDALSKLPQYRNLVPIFKALIDMASDPSLLQEDGDYSEVDEIPDARKLLYAAKNIGSSRKATPSPDTLKQAMEEESSSTSSPAPAGAPKWYKIVRFLRILKRILEILLGL